jgi:general transcription factor 3C polypeptide 3 (transcription factor C subunit 4)
MDFNEEDLGSEIMNDAFTLPLADDFDFLDFTHDQSHVREVDPSTFSIFADLNINETSVKVPASALSGGANEMEDKGLEYWKNAAATATMSFKDAFTRAPGDDQQSSEAEEDRWVVPEDAPNFEEFLEAKKEVENEIVTRQRRRKGRGTAQARTYLTPEGKRLIGEANSLFLGSRYDDAIQVLQECIKECPFSYEPYNMLAMIYEDQDNIEKALLYYMVASHVRPKDNNLWVKMCDLLLSRDMKEEAVYCLKRIIRNQPDDVVFYMEKLAQLLVELGENKAASTWFKKIVTLSPQTIESAQDYSKVMLAEGRKEDALACFKSAYEKLRDKEDLVRYSNILVELLVINRKYQEALDSVNSVKSMLAEGQFIPLDLAARECICLIFTNKLDEAKLIAQNILKLKVADVEDLFYDIGCAYHEVSCFREAMAYYRRLMLGLPNTYGSSPFMWLRLGHCGYVTNQWDCVIKNFGLFCDYYPNAKRIKLMLADAYDYNGDSATALELRKEVHEYLLYVGDKSALKIEDVAQAEEDDKDTEIIHETILSYVENRNRQLFNTRDNQKSLDVLIADLYSYRKFHKAKDSSRIRRIYGSIEDPESSGAENNEETTITSSSAMYLGLSYEEWFEVCRLYFQRLLTGSQINEATKFLKLVSDSPPFHFDKKKRWILALFGMSLFRIRKFDENVADLAYESYRYLSLAYPNSLKTSSMASLIWPGGSHDFEFYGSVAMQKHFRRCLRFCSESKDKDMKLFCSLLVINGNIMLRTRSYQHALQYYLKAYSILKENETSNTTLCLSIASCYLSIAQQRTYKNKRNIMILGFGFLQEYAALVERQGFVWYNYGRALQQIGLISFSIECYRKVLDLDPAIHPVREAAYNLSLLYLMSGSVALSQMITEKYLVF